MDYQVFREQWLPQGSFCVHEVRAWKPTFHELYLSRWVQKGWLLRLRKGWYAFPEALSWPEFHRVIAERIYRPSYISLQTALSIYGMIPEAIVQTTCVSTLKNASYANSFGEFYYYHIKPQLMFGYKPITTPGGRTYLLAEPEKALLDYLYLNPQYNTIEDLAELRIDEYAVSEELNMERLNDYLDRFNNKALRNRVTTLLSLYETC